MILPIWVFFLSLLLSVEIMNAQQAKPVLPMVAAAQVPLYPPLARAANIQGEVSISVTTDGRKVTAARVEKGHAMLSKAAAENVQTWQFANHTPTSFTVKYQYRIMEGSNRSADNPTIVLRLPTEVEVTTSRLTISDPASDVK